MPSQNPKGGLRPFSPTRFGRYTLLAPLATGGMAQVFLARVAGVEGFEKLVVIKKILSHLAADGDFVERFLDEGKIVVKLQHGSIAQVLDMGREGEEYYIAMEFVDGKDLRKIAGRCRDQQSPLPMGLALFIFTRLMDALAYAHRKKDDQDRELNLVHRDVSPQNIIVSYEGEVKIIDFGLAKSAMSLTKTSPSVILGKFFYMSPEQARHNPADRRSDLYAAGICLWELLAGKNPFDNTPPGEILRVVANPQIPRLKTVLPDLPASVDDVVARALAPDPAQRFQTAEEMRSRLTAAALEVDPAAGPETLAAFMRDRFAREYDNERKTIAFLSKLPPPEQSAEQPDDGAESDDGAEEPTVMPGAEEEGDEEEAAGPAPETAFDNTPNTPRDITATRAAEPAPSDQTPRPTGPVFGGAAEAQAHPPRRLSRPAMRAAQEPEVVDQRRETIRFDPLEFVPGKNPDGPTTPRDPVEKRAARSEVIAAAEGFEVGRPRRPVSKTRPAARPSEPAPEPAPEAEHDQEHDTPPRVTDTPRAVPVAAEPETPAPGLAAAKAPEPESQSNVLVSPELLAPEKPEKLRAARAAPPSDGADFALTPVSGIPIFTPTPHGMATISAEPRSSTTTWIFIAVGIVCMLAAAIIAYIAFRPAPEATVHSGEVVEEPETLVPARPAPRPEVPPPPAEQPAPATPEGDVDRSVLPEPVKLPHSRRVFKRAELERLFLDVDQQMARLGERFPLEKRSKLVAAYGEMRDKRDALLDQPARSAELEATARNFLKAIADTRRRLESP